MVSPMTTAAIVIDLDTVDMSPDACVLRGATLLPADWFRRLVLGILDTGNPWECVLGQVYRDAAAAAADGDSGYSYGARLLNLDAYARHYYGFNCGFSSSYPALTAAWRALAIQMLEQAA